MLNLYGDRDVRPRAPITKGFLLWMEGHTGSPFVFHIEFVWG